MIAVCGLSACTEVCRATECRAVMCVKIPAAIISGIITMIICVIEVPSRTSSSWPNVTQAPSLAPKKLASMNEALPAASKK